MTSTVAVAGNAHSFTLAFTTNSFWCTLSQEGRRCGVHGTPRMVDCSTRHGHVKLGEKVRKMRFGILPTVEFFASTLAMGQAQSRLHFSLERPSSSSDLPPTLVQHRQCASPSQWDQTDPLQISHTRRRTPFAAYCLQVGSQPAPSFANPP